MSTDDVIVFMFYPGNTLHRYGKNMTVNEENIMRASKFMSLLLRHKPEVIGLELDECGWAKIDELEKLSQSSAVRLNRSLIYSVVETSDKQRFLISDCGQFVRANQGHSIQVDLNLEEKLPPSCLYHGTASRFVESIFKKGLLRQSRQHVHLSVTRETALTVGKRHGQPVIIQVDSGKMTENGIMFYQSKNGVWLVDAVPVEYLVALPK